MKIEYTFWQENDGKYLGYLNEYPDYWTQGETLEDLEEHIKDLYKEFSVHFIPSVKKVALLEI
ncbi:type II toxin-antitoxin system HicB family antitoxin [Cyanobacterium aponinum FACHB-4101]|uniref:Type II toxin-antitoxin system HicB family antitoxin n=1 Tax=Cyanobacterium aponinum 0216 TaxID=2676140 RepID=A0A844GRI0_9CHRO|nr:type II toxin-antitoxin system HicB family antitoxin [Cyanobacterium aponinum]MBD2393776.1 type II toxin-antitoxin system HicB family antitoxin [Cyanobacterium aponinum FACHB-4101]MTF37681.1 type II toxin-antitoxin system HicB family antitoxin [Cyanobacterium aponinum 0216]